MFRNHKSAFKDKPVPLGHVGDLLISVCKKILKTQMAIAEAIFECNRKITMKKWLY